MRTRLQWILAVLVLTGVVRAQDLTLVREGRSDYSIVVARGRRNLKARGGGTPDAFEEDVGGGVADCLGRAGVPEHAIVIGSTRYAETLRPGVDVKSLGSEGFSLETRGGRVLVVGSNIRGAMYGCTALLEKLGVRWFTPRVAYVPSRATITLSPLSERQVPDFEYREVYIGEAFDRDWAARAADQWGRRCWMIGPGGRSFTIISFTVLMR